MEVILNQFHVLVFIVSVTLMLDSITLTMVVPIIPDFLLKLDVAPANQNILKETYQNKSEQFVQSTGVNILDPDSENGRVGFLLSSKAFIQLFLNPFVGYWTARSGYTFPLFSGTCILLLSVVLFAAGNSYLTLFIARSCQGVASASIAVSGLCLVADLYSTEPHRSRAMGIVLGSSALGVLIGYPFGGFMYDFVGKTLPFIIIAIVISLLIVIQFKYLENTITDNGEVGETNWRALLMDRQILLCGGAIGISTSAMAILEPCLPIWLISHIKPKKWQLGTAFIPDSIGYTLGTNVFSLVVNHEGRGKVATIAMLLVGLSAIMIPLATSMLQLVTPHFLLGLGIGAVDAALVPLLACLADVRGTSSYGTVYTIQQIAVSMAYALGPMIGGEVVRGIGFPCLMIGIGMMNLFYGSLLAWIGLPAPTSNHLHTEFSQTATYRTMSGEVGDSKE